MCYPKPGPRCSSHAARDLTKAWIECRQKSKLNSSTMTREEFSAEATRLIALREKAQDAYDATPVGMEILKRKIVDHPQSNDLYKKRLRVARATRNAQMKALKILMQERGETGRPKEKDHKSGFVDSIYQNYGLLNDFDTSNADRIGWAESSEKFHKMHELLSRASDGWMKRLSPEQVSALDWYTSGESMSLSIYKAAKRQGKEYKPRDWENYTEEELERRSQVLALHLC